MLSESIMTILRWVAKDWADLSYELFVSKDYEKAKIILSKLMSDINQLSDKATR